MYHLFNFWEVMHAKGSNIAAQPAAIRCQPVSISWREQPATGQSFSSRRRGRSATAQLVSIFLHNYAGWENAPGLGASIHNTSYPGNPGSWRGSWIWSFTGSLQ